MRERERERRVWVTCEKLELGKLNSDWIGMGEEKKKAKACNEWIMTCIFIGDVEWCHDHPEAGGDGYI